MGEDPKKTGQADCKGTPGPHCGVTVQKLVVRWVASNLLLMTLQILIDMPFYS